MSKKKSSSRALSADTPKLKTEFNKAALLHSRGEFAAAQAIYQKILKKHPAHFDSLHYSGLAAYQLGNLQESIDFYIQALAIRDDVPEFYSHLGITLWKLNEMDAALESFDKALALKPDMGGAWCNRANVLHDMKQFEAALESLDKAISCDPNNAISHNNRGNALRGLFRWDEAFASFQRSLAISPDYVDAWINLGNLLLKRGLLEAAGQCFQCALSLRADMPEALYGMGSVHDKTGALEEALKYYHQAFVIKHDLPELFSCYFYLKLKFCLWDFFQEQHDLLEKLIRHDVPVADPLAILALNASPEIHRQVVAQYVRERGWLNSMPRPQAKLPRHEKIRIGYYSPDFRHHPVAHLSMDFFDAHDREKFELHAFSFGSDDTSPQRQRIKATFGNNFHDVNALSDEEIIDLSRQLEIDIALDLAGFTTNARTEIFLSRVAPVQINYMGFPGTMTLDCMDYTFFDPVFSRHEARPDWTENFVWLPCSVVPARRSTPISSRPMSRAEFGLPEKGFVFCCFNNPYKIQPPIFDIWMRLLKAVEGSVLWVLARNEIAFHNLQKNAEMRGVSADRIINAPYLSLNEHLAMQRLADLFLDTLPYNAASTANDALLVGLPLLTQTGESAISRAAASQLLAVGLPELITHTAADYEATALELAQNPSKMQAIHEKLARRWESELFDVEGFTRTMERAYTMMYERYQADLPPADFVVSALG